MSTQWRQGGPVAGVVWRIPPRGSTVPARVWRAYHAAILSGFDEGADCCEAKGFALAALEGEQRAGFARLHPEEGEC